MKFSVAFALLILVPRNILGRHLNFRDDLTLDDLRQTNVTCALKQTCKEEDASSNKSKDRKCSCGSDCGQFGDCCIDSPFRNDSITPMLECRNTAPTFSKDAYFLVSRCPSRDSNSDSPWRDLCEKQWNGEDDMMMLAPVSSLDTFVAYKNYYCFRCHEGDSGKFRSWDISIFSDFVDESRVSEDFSIAYDKEKQSWTATTGDDYLLEDLHFDFSLPPGLDEVRPDSCDIVLVSDCVDSWKDEDTRGKCRSYTAIVYSKHNDSVSFRNPHCALCNFVSVEDIHCGFDVSSWDSGPKKVFSFALLLDIGRDDESETKKCEENQLWDPYGRKCRRIACAIPGYVVKEGRCTSP